ncbi:hypothetical protein [Roseibium suaedae]|uniref:hypothetical protein n=1 Tax=Roseibium suaedae TaxID=735517 RepID=UPI001114F78A|nr:hypothetical protein [Roseibium suaedae]
MTNAPGPLDILLSILADQLTANVVNAPEGPTAYLNQVKAQALSKLIDLRRISTHHLSEEEAARAEELFEMMAPHADHQRQIIETFFSNLAQRLQGLPPQGAHRH